ncbi:MAG: endoribonuclease MazF [Synechococcales cyanobacterium RM1_1_8]|nr:endoribonuclease MazF [Synechococcales cyanobacterium RM1_1_8]
MVTQRNYVPERGDIVYLGFDPTKGREQRGYRPALVMSPALYNGKSSLALMMPITSKRKGYPFEVALPQGLTTEGVVLVDQVKCLDWRSRQAKFVESVPAKLVAEVQAKIEPLLF